MDKNPPDPAALTEALRRLGNPYAKLQIAEEDPIEAFSSDFHPLTEAERTYVRRLENPYASLCIARELNQASPQASTASQQPHDDKPESTISQRDFEAECRRIFRQYIPATEKGRFRPHHRAFIERNRPRAPVLRSRLVEGLRRYDLSSIAGFQPLFNREREDLTEAKLAKIEQTAIETSKS
jgi:hypothetical protein